MDWESDKNEDSHVKEATTVALLGREASGFSIIDRFERLFFRFYFVSLLAHIRNKYNWTESIGYFFMFLVWSIKRSHCCGFSFQMIRNVVMTLTMSIFSRIEGILGKLSVGILLSALVVRSVLLQPDVQIRIQSNSLIHGLKRHKKK